MIKYGFKRRTRPEAWKHRGKDELYEINEKFFNSWTNEMAYVLGFILTDGSISDNDNSVKISIKDVELLEKIRTKLKSNHPIKYLKAYGIYCFSFSRKKMTERLSKLGITSNKSLDIEFPKVPDKFMSHFIRGVFDGDGSVFFESRNKKSPLRVSFTSGSKKFITALEDIIHTQAGVSKRTIYKLHRKNTSYYIRYCHKDSLKFIDYIYADADESMWLERKHRKFLEGMLFTCSATDINKVWDHL
jgi:DNA-binding transcriptional regulator WhiA